MVKEEEKKEEVKEEESKEEKTREGKPSGSQEAKIPEKKEDERISPKTYIYKKVKSVVFSVFSPQQIKKMASAKIVTPELYDKEGYPVDGGLMDIRLGVIDPGLRCKTCRSKLKECNGHFGYIELARPTMHISFISMVLNLLRSTCKECGRVLIPKDRFDKYKNKLDKVEKEEGLESRRDAVK